jgi:hypothetical protein
VNPWEAQALLAPARQLTPPADEREIDLRVAKLLLPTVAVFVLLGATNALAATGGGGLGGTPTKKSTKSTKKAKATVQPTGGAALGATYSDISTPSKPVVAGWKAKIIHGVAYAPSMAPMAVKKAIWGGNRIHTKPYIAVHYSSMAWMWPGYDCSGSVSYVLYKAGLLSSSPDVSGDFESYGSPGPGRWITVWGSADHAFMEVAGLLFDTAQYASVTPAGSGPRWQPASVIPEQLGDGNDYTEVHPTGY